MLWPRGLVTRNQNVNDICEMAYLENMTSLPQILCLCEYLKIFIIERKFNI